MIKLYGIAQSRALRSIWAAEEVGVDYELVQTNFMGDAKKPEYLAINPNGRIPALVDGELKLFESMAINLHLAQRYGGKLWPDSPDDQSRALQWSFWGITELEPPLIDMVLNKLMLPKDQRDSAKVAEAEQALERPLPVLDAHLADREYLLGSEFTIADLNVAGVFGMSHFVEYDFAKFAHVQRWMDACTSRPSYARAQQR